MNSQPVIRPPADEPPFYYFVNGWYKGEFSGFLDVSGMPGTSILESNYETLRKEILNYYESHASEISANYSPYNYVPKGWKTINLYSYFLKYTTVCEKFPEVNRIVQQIPNVCGVQIGILEPHSRIKAHMGDTNGLIRSHLGIRIPGALPELGFRVGSEERCWEEGKVLGLCVSHRHYAWNSTNHYRIVLVVDVIRDEYANKKHEIAAKTMAVVVLKHFSIRIPSLKRTPKFLAVITRNLISYVFRILLFTQRTTGLKVERLIRPNS
jgi:hypothetical protein